MQRLGTYQKAVLRGIAREGRQPISIRNGYSRQIRSLTSRKLIKRSGSSYVLTSRGRNRISK
jgi:hypothetical protein